jgi:TonB family protein
MRVRVRGDSDALRSGLSFSTSGMIHGGLLALVLFGRAGGVPESPKSLYDQAIRGREKQIVWYRAPDKLPEIAPGERKSDRRPLRATQRAQQRIVAGPRDDGRPPQLVWAPAPEVALPASTPLPNVLAVEVKPLVKAFTPPPVKTVAAPTPVLPDAAEVAVKGAAPAGPSLAPLRRTFTPPAAKTTATSAPVLPDADRIALNGAAPAGPSLAPLRRRFTPPAGKPAPASTPALPDADRIALNGAAPAGPSLAPLRRTFTPPAGKPAPASTPALPDADRIALNGAAPAGPSLAPLRKTFTPPAAPARPAVTSPSPDLPEVTQLAIVGLHPSKAPDLPAPPAPRDAGFSAGPKPQPDGAASDGSASGLVVPGVTVRDGVSRQSLLAAIRPMRLPVPDGPLPPAPTRVSNAPDASLQGRVVYSIAIQMPNVTSYSGSWLVWYAERQQSSGGEMRAPTPVRKVDPKYIAAAAAEGVQGVVRLGAVIRRDGRIEAVKLLRHLDDRLDASAMESLAKWQFEPAQRNGAPVDVDAVFEIPFRLAPKSAK